jgi:hypothetical protein
MPRQPQTSANAPPQRLCTCAPSVLLRKQAEVRIPSYGHLPRAAKSKASMCGTRIVVCDLMLCLALAQVEQTPSCTCSCRSHSSGAATSAASAPARLSRTPMRHPGRRARTRGGRCRSRRGTCRRWRTRRSGGVSSSVHTMLQSQRAAHQPQQSALPSQMQTAQICQMQQHHAVQPHRQHQVSQATRQRSPSTSLRSSWGIPPEGAPHSLGTQSSSSSSSGSCCCRLVSISSCPSSRQASHSRLARPKAQLSTSASHQQTPSQGTPGHHALCLHCSHAIHPGHLLHGCPASEQDCPPAEA